MAIISGDSGGQRNATAAAFRPEHAPGQAGHRLRRRDRTFLRQISAGMRAARSGDSSAIVRWPRFPDALSHRARRNAS
ncbi:MAG: hypothetical protein EOP93_03865 [Lysobacteraceae bacterium]|nr:MAG: hypothetical protein EOP93_03865 [Xanthomonadaceae bacterium]